MKLACVILRSFIGCRGLSCALSRWVDPATVRGRLHLSQMTRESLEEAGVASGFTA